MSYIVVSPLSQLVPTAEIHKPQHMVTLINAGTEVIRPAMVEEENHLFLAFNDINEARNGLVAPQREHVLSLITFVRNWSRSAPLLIHCLMGISRSTAAAFIAACALNPSRDEKALAIELRKIAPSATPNLLLVTLADDVLERDGRMVEAIRIIGRGAEASEGKPFILTI